MSGLKGGQGRLSRWRRWYREKKAETSTNFLLLLCTIDNSTQFVRFSSLSVIIEEIME